MKGLLKSAILSPSSTVLTNESGYETNENVVLNLNSENPTSGEPDVKNPDDTFVSDIKEENQLDDIIVMSGTENLKEMVSEIDEEIKDTIIVAEIAEETVTKVEVAEEELKNDGTVSTETSLSLVTSYNKLLDLLPDNTLTHITKESASKYGKETLYVTKESAGGAIQKVKQLVKDIIAKIAEKIKKLMITVFGIVDNIEKSSKAFEELASGEYTDVKIDRYEDHIPVASVFGRLTAIEEFKVNDILDLITFTNRGADLEGLVKTFVDGVKNDNFETLKKLFFLQSDLPKKYALSLKKNPAYKEVFKNMGNIFPIRLSGTQAYVLCSEITNASTNERKLVIKDFKLEVSNNVKKSLKDNKEILSRADLITISQKLSQVGRDQRQSIKNSLAYLDKIKAAADTVTEESKLKNEIASIVSILTRVVFINTYSGIVSNRLILGMLAEFIRLYEKQNQTKK